MADVDLAAGVIRVERGSDPAEGEIQLKSHAGRRKAPVLAIFRDYLDAPAGRRPRAALIFGRTPESPFAGNRLQRHADEAWAAANAREREAAEKEGRRPELLERITPHELRHSYAAMMIAAGVNAKALSTFMGHANISITLDRYGHLMPGSEAEAAGLVESYLIVQRKEARTERAPRGRDPWDKRGTMTQRFSDLRRPDTTERTA